MKSCSFRLTSLLALVVLSFVVATAPAFAQAGTASIAGTVTDEQGAALPSVTVTVKSTTTGTTRWSSTGPAIRGSPRRGVFVYSRLP